MMLNYMAILIAWSVQWLCIWLFVITILDGLVLHLPHDHNYITTQPYLALLISFLSVVLVMMIVDLPLKLVTEKGVFALIGRYWQRIKKRPPE